MYYADRTFSIRRAVPESFILTWDNGPVPLSHTIKHNKSSQHTQ